MRKIVDSNFLQRNELRVFLSESPSNFAVLTDYVSMEAYKGDTLTSIYRSMEILAEYPSQVIILHGTQHACSLAGDGLSFPTRMIDDDQTKGFAEYCHMLRLAQRGNTSLQRQLLEHGREANAHMDRMLQDAGTLSGAFDDIATTYTPAELRQLRKTNVPYPESLVEKTVTHVMMVAAILLREHPAVTNFPQAHEAPDRFVFRIALCGLLLALRWIAVGGAANVRAERLRNDVVDMNFAVFATYFDGILTADQKLASLYYETNIWLTRIFSERGPLQLT
jgi:hypothetical protein